MNHICPPATHSSLTDAADDSVPYYKSAATDHTHTETLSSCIIVLRMALPGTLPSSENHPPVHNLLGTQPISTTT